MLAIAQFPSWYWPVAQALELSEMSYGEVNPDHLPIACLIFFTFPSGMAIGYDWLYNVLTPSQQQIIEQAIITHTLQVTQQNFDQGLWWTQDIYNWCLVSHGESLLSECQTNLCHKD